MLRVKDDCVSVVEILNTELDEINHNMPHTNNTTTIITCVQFVQVLYNVLILYTFSKIRKDLWKSSFVLTVNEHSLCAGS